MRRGVLPATGHLNARHSSGPLRYSKVSPSTVSEMLASFGTGWMCTENGTCGSLLDGGKSARVTSLARPRYPMTSGG